VASGGKALYVTLLAESHARMLSHLSTMTFFDPATVGEGIHYISGYEALRNEGLKGLISSRKPRWDDFIAKPFAFSDLLQAVRRLLPEAKE